MNPRKGCTAAVVKALRPKLIVLLAVMQVNESHPLSSSREGGKDGSEGSWFLAGRNKIY